MRACLWRDDRVDEYPCAWPEGTLSAREVEFTLEGAEGFFRKGAEIPGFLPERPAARFIYGKAVDIEEILKCPDIRARGAERDAFGDLACRRKEHPAG